MPNVENSILEDHEKSPSKWPILLFGGFILGVLVYLFISVLFRSPAGSELDNAPDFDPMPFAELEVKGTRPQGETSWIAVEVPTPPIPSEALLAKGRDLFNKACSGCHGSGGYGDGSLSKRAELTSLPANLTLPIRSIKIRTTLSGFSPMKEDIFRTITRGLPGTAMQSFRELSAEDRWALTYFVRTFSSEYEKLSGTPIEIPAKIPISEDILAVGKSVFERTCITCHGEKGLGTTAGLYDQKTGKLWPGARWARKKGLSRLSGFSEDDIARTLLTGFHTDSPMTSFRTFFYPELKPIADAKAAMDRRFWGTVWYVKQLDESTSK